MLFIMNIVNHLLKTFIYEEKFDVIMIFILSITVNVIQTTGISSTVSKIINSIKDSNRKSTYSFFKVFIGLSILFLIFNYAYKCFHIRFISKMKQWLREKLFGILLKTNNENFSNVNFINLSTPINRTSSVCFTIFNNIISYILPISMFFIVICGYFIYKDPLFGSCFLLANLLIVFYIYLIWDSMTEKNEIYENSNMNTESSLLELLNNADKIIHRGQIEKELGDFSQTVNKTVTSAQNFFSHINDQTTIISAMIYTIMLLSVAYMIYSFYNKKIDSVFFVTILSILILYRDRMNTMVLQLSDFIESNGRGSALLKYFKEMEEGYDEVNSRVYENSDLDFNNITFDKASFGYSSSDTTIFNDMSISIETSGQKIIGMTGKSGRGKSTFVKLMLKIYRLTSGNIYIDDVNINDIDPDYIRKNIVYINQSGKLFDKVVIDNMLYACDDDEICKDRLEEIMSYEKIRDLYKNVDLNSNESGSLGENLSGGQRQIVNLINGLVHPSKILILDEPTNALDGELKRTVIKLIRDFKKYKKCIFIITHDSEMNSLFDETLKL